MLLEAFRNAWRLPDLRNKLLITGLILEAYTVQRVIDGKEKDVVEGTGFVICFTMYAIVYGLGVLSWLLIDPTKPIVTDEPQATDGSGTTGT